MNRGAFVDVNGICDILVHLCDDKKRLTNRTGTDRDQLGYPCSSPSLPL